MRQLIKKLTEFREVFAAERFGPLALDLAPGIADDRDQRPAALG